jgi:hypothetical protein
LKFSTTSTSHAATRALPSLLISHTPNIRMTCPCRSYP